MDATQMEGAAPEPETDAACSHIGAPEGAKFCPDCGASLTGPVEGVTPGGGFISSVQVPDDMTVEKAQEILARYQAEREQFGEAAAPPVPILTAPPVVPEGRGVNRPNRRQQQADAGADTIVVRPRQAWLRDALAGQPFSAQDGKTYQCDPDGQAAVAADSGQELHPDWELVSGTPRARNLDALSGEAPVVPGSLRWVKAKHATTYGQKVSGPAPLAYVALFDADGWAAVPENSGFGEHPDYKWGDYLTAEEVDDEAVLRKQHRLDRPAEVPGGTLYRDAHYEQEVARLAAGAQSGAFPALGLYSAMTDPNSTGVPGVMAPPPAPPVNASTAVPVPTDDPVARKMAAEELEARLRAGVQQQGGNPDTVQVVANSAGVDVQRVAAAFDAPPFQAPAVPVAPAPVAPVAPVAPGTAPEAAESAGRPERPAAGDDGPKKPPSGAARRRAAREAAEQAARQ